MNLKRHHKIILVVTILDGGGEVKRDEELHVVHN